MVRGRQLLPASATNLTLSPFTWVTNADGSVTTNSPAGPYVKSAFGKTSISMVFSLGARLSATSARSMSTACIPTSASRASDIVPTLLSLATGLPTATHQFRFDIRSGPSRTDEWIPQPSVQLVHDLWVFPRCGRLVRRAHRLERRPARITHLCSARARGWGPVLIGSYSHIGTEFDSDLHAPMPISSQALNTEYGMVVHESNGWYYSGTNNVRGSGLGMRELLGRQNATLAAVC